MPSRIDILGSLKLSAGKCSNKATSALFKSSLEQDSKTHKCEGYESKILALKRHISKEKNLINLIEEPGFRGFKCCKSNTEDIYFEDKWSMLKNKLNHKKKVKVGSKSASNVQGKQLQNTIQMEDTILCICSNTRFIKVCLKCGSLDKSLTIIESKMKMAMHENDILKKEIRSIAKNHEELASALHKRNNEFKSLQQCLEKEILKSKKLLCLDRLQKSRKTITSNHGVQHKKRLEKFRKMDTKSYKKDKKNKYGQKKASKDIVGYTHQKLVAKKKILNKLPEGNKLASKTKFNSDNYDSFEKIWVCFDCIPPKMLSEEKFVQHAESYLHLENCIPYKNVVDADSAIAEYENISESEETITYIKRSRIKKLDESIIAFGNNEITNTSNTDESTNTTNNFRIKNEFLDMTYCWNLTLDEEVNSCILPKKLEQNNSSKVFHELKDKLNIKCSTCKEEFPTKERKNLHTCNSISDQIYVSKESSSRKKV